MTCYRYDLVSYPLSFYMSYKTGSVNSGTHSWTLSFERGKGLHCKACTAKASQIRLGLNVD